MACNTRTPRRVRPQPLQHAPSASAWRWRPPPLQLLHPRLLLRLLTLRLSGCHCCHTVSTTTTTTAAATPRLLLCAVAVRQDVAPKPHARRGRDDDGGVCVCVCVCVEQVVLPSNGDERERAESQGVGVTTKRQPSRAHPAAACVTHAPRCALGADAERSHSISAKSTTRGADDAGWCECARDEWGLRPWVGRGDWTVSSGRREARFARHRPCLRPALAKLACRPRAAACRSPLPARPSNMAGVGFGPGAAGGRVVCGSPCQACLSPSSAPHPHHPHALCAPCAFCLRHQHSHTAFTNNPTLLRHQLMPGWHR
jgi:hypothetical protein